MTELHYQLPPNTVLEQYRIEKTLSAGGFSIVYYAIDTQNNTPVVIKEYLPQKLAKRIRNNKVGPLKPSCEDSFNEGRKLFFQEASALAKLKHPNIVNVNNFFNANETVYMVMDYKEGRNLEAYIHEHQGQMSEVFIRTIFPPLCHGLTVVHNAGLLHFDIKPSNIHLQPGGIPILLDFGAVYQMRASRQSQPRPVVTQGFSPIEQYDSKGYVGPWTDIYALGATMRACMDGKSPPCARDRNKNDELRPAAQVYKRRYTAGLLAAVDQAMEINPELRPQSIDEFLKTMNEEPEPAEDTVFDKLVANLPWRSR